MTNLKSLEKLLVRYGAPTLCGIKPASLFTVKPAALQSSELDALRKVLLGHGIIMEAFRTNNDVIMIFAYNFIWMRKILEDSFINAYLLGKNYHVDKGTVPTLNELFLRLQNHTAFPHEVGIFLGYPLEDVIAFENNGGKNCKYCGYWKSYTNPDEAKKCCCEYLCCSRMCQKWFEEGLTVPQIINKYKEAAAKAA